MKFTQRLIKIKILKWPLRLQAIAPYKSLDQAIQFKIIFLH